MCSSPTAGCLTICLSDLDDFTRGYITCALWSTNDESDEQGGAPLDANYGPEDLALETLAQMIADCERFQEDNADDLEEAENLYVVRDRTSAASYAGHDFWLSRNGHGAGYFDRGDEEVWDRLTAACKQWPEVFLYVGDDGMIHA